MGVDMRTALGGKHVQFDADEWRELDASVCPFLTPHATWMLLLPPPLLFSVALTNSAN